MSKIYKFEACYIDENFVKRFTDIESMSNYTQRRREFTNECARNGWELVYFRRAK